MSQTTKEIEKILDLAKSVRKEIVFQNKTQYQEFKEKHIGKQKGFSNLIFQLNMLNFSNECIYWSNRYLEQRVCNPQERHFILIQLINSYFAIENFEKVLDNGPKLLEVRLKFPNTHSETCCQSDSCSHEPILMSIFEKLAISANQLGRHIETMKYLKEFVKQSVQWYNNDPSANKLSQQKKLTLLDSYSRFINCQIQCKCFKKE